MLIVPNLQPDSRTQRIAALEEQYIKLLESKIAALTAVPNIPGDSDATSLHKVTSLSEVSKILKHLKHRLQYVNQHYEKGTQSGIENEAHSR